MKKDGVQEEMGRGGVGKKQRERERERILVFYDIFFPSPHKTPVSLVFFPKAAPPKSGGGDKYDDIQPAALASFEKERATALPGHT